MPVAEAEGSRTGKGREARHCGSSVRVPVGQVDAAAPPPFSSVAAWRVSPRGAGGPRGLTGHAEEPSGEAESRDPVFAARRRGRTPSQGGAGRTVNG